MTQKSWFLALSHSLSSFCLIYVNLLALLTVVPNGFKEFLQIWNKQASARVGGRRNALNPFVVIGAFLLPNINEAFAENIDSALIRIEEEVIGMFNDRRRSYDLARFGIEDGQARGYSTPDKEPVVRLVKRHGKIGRAAYRPAGKHRTLHQIGNLHFLFIWNVHKDTGSELLQLKRFGMGVHVDLPGLLSCVVQDGKRAAASRSRDFAPQEFFSSVADDDMLASWVIADIVGV